MTKLRAFAILLIALGGAGRALAQPPGDDPIARVVFPPELVMKYSQEIGLDDGQRSAIREKVQAAQTKFLNTQWDLQEESQKLVRLLQAKPVDEGAVLAEVDKVLAFEREIKRTQIPLLVRIKNVLTDAQQVKLMELRRRPD